MGKPRIATRVPTLAPQTEPNEEPKRLAPALGDGEQLAIDFIQAKTIRHHIEDLYRLVQGAVERFGGVVALAASMEKPVPGVGLKVRHAPDSKGEVQKATVDMLGHLVADHAVRAYILESLADLWGYKAPVARCEPTLEQKYRILLAATDERTLARAAEAGGFDAGSFKR